MKPPLQPVGVGRARLVAERSANCTQLSNQGSSGLRELIGQLGERPAGFEPKGPPRLVPHQDLRELGATDGAVFAWHLDDQS